MTKIYINDHLLPNTKTFRLEYLLKYLNINPEQESFHMEMTLPTYTKDEIASAYIETTGTLYDYLIKKEELKESNQIMVAAYLKYPQYVYFESNAQYCIRKMFENEQQYLSILQPLGKGDNIKDDHYAKHKDSYDKALQKLVDEVTFNSCYTDMFLDGTKIDILDNEEEILLLLKHNTAKYIRYICDENANCVKFDHNYLKFEDDEIYYTKQLYNYNDNMVTVTDAKSLYKELQHNTRNIFINGDIECSEVVNLVDNYKITEDDKKNKLYNITYNVDPDDFATWEIGPKCWKLNGLLYKYKHPSGKQPQVSGWSVEHLIECKDLFRESNVQDLSELHFVSCEDATGMYRNCRQLKHAGKMHDLRYCDYMLQNTAIKSVDECIINTEDIETMNFAFDGVTCDEMLNNRQFDCLTTFMFDKILHGCTCKSAFNYCDFRGIERLITSNYGKTYDVSYDLGINVESVLNECIFDICTDVRIIDTTSNIKNIMNNISCSNDSYCVFDYGDEFVLFVKNAVNVLNNVTFVRNLDIN